MYDLIVIGGGASGMMAAISASRKGFKTLILEKNNQLGRKIKATGNGRCNYTNLLASPDDYNNIAFVSPAFDLMNVFDTISFFNNLGIHYKQEGEGRLYPSSEQASSIIDVLELELKRLNVDVLFEHTVTEITKTSIFNIKVDNKIFKSKNVIIATGGLASPVTGSTGDGYSFSKVLGHSLTPTFPALTRVILDDSELKNIQGVRFTSKINLRVGNEIVESQQGDIIFTKTGISGLAVFALSKTVNEMLLKKKKVFINVALIDGLNELEIVERIKMSPHKTLFESLVGFINKKLIKPVLKRSNVKNFDVLIKDTTDKVLNDIAYNLINFDFEVLSTGSFEDAQITVGGIDIKDINPNTLESNLTKGLYFTGEVLDIDAKSGGYNLQWAWSSGYLAGQLLGKGDKNE